MSSVSLIDGHIDNDAPKMTDEQIIDALACCLSDNPPCFACKYDGDTTTVDECMGELMKDAFDLINHQKVEIERLESANKSLAQQLEDDECEYD